MKQFLFLLSLTSLLAACNAVDTNQTPTEGQPKIERVSVEVFKTQLEAYGEKVNLVDVRTPEEFAQGAIDGAVNINLRADDFEHEMNKLDKNTPIMVYCQAGSRSKQASQKLEKLGFKTIYDLEVGYSGWPK